jgi:general secretion pathway protein D
MQARDKGDSDYKAAKAAESHQDWDSALKYYMSAIDKNPGNPVYTMGMRRMRFQSSQLHVNQGQKLRADGKTVEALGEFQKALIADPASSIAIQEIKRTQATLVEKPKAVERPASIEGPPELKPVIGTIQTLKINNQPPKVLYETIGKMAGINVVFDSQYPAQPRNANMDISNMPIQQAFDYLAMLTKTYWKPITSNTIFVTEDSVAKRHDYEDEVMKVFYLSNTTSVQELQEIATAVRTLADIRRVFPINSQKVLLVRATTDQMALAEKLLHDLDRAKSEVAIDVIVMQVNSTYSRSLAATLSSAGTTGLQQSIGFLPTTNSTTGTTSNGTVPLSQIPHLSINQFSTSLPSAIVNAVMSDARTKTMNKPQVRASDGMKVDLIIGEKIPFATGSFSSGVSVSSSVSPLVSTQFNYAEVGLKLSITPQIHLGNEVTLHIEVEVSEVDTYVNIGGISQPVIGQTKNTADIRLREGEVNILSGLSQNSDGTTVAGLPGLTNIPLLGQFLFGSSTKNKTDSELMIALIPHIIRTASYSEENAKGTYAGTEQAVKVYHEPKAP